MRNRSRQRRPGAAIWGSVELLAADVVAALLGRWLLLGLMDSARVQTLVTVFVRGAV